MNKPLYTYIVIAYAITWSFVVGMYLLYTRHIITLDALNILFSIGALGPFLSAIFTSYFFYGTTGLRNMRAMLSASRLNRASLMLVCSPLLLFGVGLLIYPLVQGRWFSFADTAREFHLSGAASSGVASLCVVKNASKLPYCVK